MVTFFILSKIPGIFFPGKRERKSATRDGTGRETGNKNKASILTLCLFYYISTCSNIIKLWGLIKPLILVVLTSLNRLLYAWFKPCKALWGRVHNKKRAKIRILSPNRGENGVFYFPDFPHFPDFPGVISRPFPGYINPVPGISRPVECIVFSHSNVTTAIEIE